MTNSQQLWDRCQQRFRERIPAEQYEQWIKPLRADLDTSGVRIYTTNGWTGRRVQASYGEVIRSVVRAEANDPSLKVVFSNKRNISRTQPIRAEAQSPSEDEKSPPQQATLVKNYTFGQFVTGGTKDAEKAVAYDVADSFGDDLMTLVIFGDSGLGKTHLLHAIGNHIYENYPEKAVGLTHSTSLVNEVTSVLRPSGAQAQNINAAMNALHAKYAQHDVILLDDLHRLVGKKKIQEEFLELLNIWQERNTKLAFTSLGQSADLDQLDPSLRSRLLGGISIHAMEPDEDAKVEILLQHATQEDIDLPDPVAEYLASQLDSDIRILKGTLLSIAKAQTLSSRNKRTITTESVDRALHGLNRDRKPVTAERVLEAVATRFDVSVHEVTSSSRVRNKLIPRQMGMLLAQELTTLPNTEIATAFGRKDHTTVKHAVVAIEQKMKADIQLRRDYAWLKRQLKA